MSDIKLLPCPICGESVKILKLNNNRCYIYCQGCGCSYGMYITDDDMHADTEYINPEELAYYWNMRYSVPVDLKTYKSLLKFGITIEGNSGGLPDR